MTFIVVGDFVLNASLLDDARLGKQRVEAKQILDAILTGRGWIHHPITKSWGPYVPALVYYYNCIVIEWIKRGKDNNMPLYQLPPLILMPWWATWDRLHQSHRAMLIRKDPLYYTSKFTVEDEYKNYGYIWPNKISYDRRNDHLSTLTDPIPEYLVNARYCTAALKSGLRKGQPCNKIIKDNAVNCTIHSK